MSSCIIENSLAVMQISNIRLLDLCSLDSGAVSLILRFYRPEEPLSRVCFGKEAVRLDILGREARRTAEGYPCRYPPGGTLAVIPFDPKKNEE